MDIIQAAIAARTAKGLSLKAWGAEGYTADAPFTCHARDAEQRTLWMVQLRERGFMVEAIGPEPLAFGIEAYTPDGPSCWWPMPYRFNTREDADTFSERLKAENPGRAFRVAP